MQNTIHKIYHTGGPVEYPGRLWVESAGHYSFANHYVRDRIRDDCLLAWCVGGSGRYRIGDRLFPIQSGQVFAVPANVRHSYNCSKDGWELLWTHFGGPLAGEMLKWLGISLSQPVFAIAQEDKLHSHFDAILDILRIKDRFYEIEAAGILHGILTLLKKYRIDHGSVRTDIELFAEGKYDSVEQMARAAGMSQYHFIRKFRQATGMTPWNYILRNRIARAKEILSRRDISIKQAAFEAGFQDADYFSRIFKKMTGMTASRFRQTLFGSEID